MEYYFHSWKPGTHSILILMFEKVSILHVWDWFCFYCNLPGKSDSNLCKDETSWTMKMIDKYDFRKVVMDIYDWNIGSLCCDSGDLDEWKTITKLRKMKSWVITCLWCSNTPQDEPSTRMQKWPLDILFIQKIFLLHHNLIPDCFPTMFNLSATLKTISMSYLCS